MLTIIVHASRTTGHRRQAIEAAVERVLAGEAPADVVATSVLSKTTLSKYVAMFRAQGLIVIKKRAKPSE